MLDGWFELTPELLDECRLALTSGDLTRFFDGQEPEWRHALAPSEQIPRRPVAVDGLAKLRAPAAGSQALVFLVGADGVGKTTALLQIACDLVADGRRVVVRSPGAKLDPSTVAELAPAGDDRPPAGGERPPAGDHPSGRGRGWVLVSDDANEIAHDVEKAIEQVFAADRHDIHWLLSAREADWKGQFLRYGRSLEPSWERFGELWPALGDRATLLGVNAAQPAAVPGAWAAVRNVGAVADAAAVVTAWAAAGCLGALESLPEPERALALEERSNKKVGISDATLLGASLDLRYGAEGLPTFVEQAIKRLDGDPAQAAFLYAAAAQVAGVDGLDLSVLADLVGVDREDRRSAILGRLASSGLASGSADALRPRHRAIAQAAVQLLAAGRLQGDLAEMFRRLVRGTATTGNEVKALSAGGAIMNCGPQLAEKLQQLGLTAARSHEVAMAVADEAESALPDFLLFSVARARTYREANQPAEARRILRARLADATAKNDWDVVGRAYLHELSGPETSVDRLAEGATLAGLALADGEGLSQVTMADAKVALLALGAACSALAVPDDGAVFRRQLRACSHLGEKVTPKWDQRARFDFHTLAAAADDYDIPKTSAAEALLWLGETVTTAAAMVEDAEIRELARRVLPDDGKLAFSHLEFTIGLGRLPWAKE